VSAPRDKGGVTAGLFAIALAATVAFGSSVTFGFVYDDHWTVEGNRALDMSLGRLLGTLFAGRGVAQGIPDATRPTMVTSLWVDRRLFGVDPSGYHLHSLLLYCLSSVLAGAAVYSITRRSRAALVGGLVFAVAPVHAEVVAAVNYREDLEAAIAVFALVAWLFCPRRRDGFDRAVPAAAVLLFGLLAKESAVALFPAALAIAAAGRRFAGWTRRRRASLVALCVTAVGYGAWRVWLRLAGRDDVPLALGHRGLGERLGRTARYAVRTALDALFPIHWSPEYAPEGPASIAWVLPLLGLVVLVVLLSKRRRFRAPAAGLAVALVTPLVTSPLLSPVNEIADRYVFIASLGGAIVWGSLLDPPLARIPPPFRLPALFIALAPLVIVCHQAIQPFRSDPDLWRIATERAPLSARAFAGLARERRLAGDLDGADQAVTHALLLDPRSLTARVTEIYNRLARGNVADAAEKIREIEAMGGRNQRGMRKAIRCAALPPVDAARCIDAPREP